MKIVFLGPPGVGKGMIGQRVHYEVISTSTLLKAEFNKDTPEAKQLRENNSKGILAPDEMVIGLIDKTIEGKDNFILDGFPRTIPQAEALDKITKIDLVIYLTAPQEILIKRLLGRVIGKDGTVYHKEHHPPPADVEIIHRSDDTEEVAMSRQEVYLKQTHPLVEYYKKQGKLFEIDANRPLQHVVDDVLSHL